MRDYANETTVETAAPRQSERVGPLPQQFIASALLNSFRGKLVTRAALATQVALTLAVAFVLVAALWAKAFG
jgi:hypothetical protein